MDTISLQRLSFVMPELSEKVQTMAAELMAQRIEIRVTQGLRTAAEQDALYVKAPKVTNAQGGYSMHNFGLAVDCVPNIPNTPTWTPDWNGSDNRYAQMVQAGIEQGLVAGAKWHSFVDMPHFQMPECPVTPTDRMRTDLKSGGLLFIWENLREGKYAQ